MEGETARGSRKRSLEPHRPPSIKLDLSITYDIFGDSRRIYNTQPLDGGFAMTKSELVKRVAELSPDLPHSDVERVVEAIFTSIGDALTRGDRIEIRGFGTFSVKHRSARLGKNPRTGATVEVSPKAIPYFRTGKHLHARLNEER
jgi:integration host factor subunit beta